MFSKQALPFPGDTVRYKDDIAEGKDCPGEVVEIAAINGDAMVLVKWQDEISNDDWFGLHALVWDKPVVIEQR